MNEVFSFGSYYPGDSPLHKCDARTKLTLGFVFLIVALMAQGFAGLGVIAVFVAFLYVVSRIPFGKAMRCGAGRPRPISLSLAACMNTCAGVP